MNSASSEAQVSERVFGETTWMMRDFDVTVTGKEVPLLLADTGDAWSKAVHDGIPAYRRSTHPEGCMIHNLPALGVIAPEGWSVAEEGDWTALAAIAQRDPCKK